MKYTLPLLIDGQTREPLGLFSLETTAGPIVLVFSNTVKLADFYEAGSRMVNAEGNLIGSVDIEAPSFDQVVEELWSMGLLERDASLLPDSDPLCDQLLAQMAA
jgi:hypothetical protein